MRRIGLPVAILLLTAPAALTPALADAPLQLTEAPGGGLGLELGAIPAPQITAAGRQMKLRFHGAVTIDPAALRRLHSVAWATTNDHGDTVLTLWSRGGKLAGTVAGSTLTIAAGTASASGNAVGITPGRPGKPARPAANVPSTEELDQLKRSVASQLQTLNSLKPPTLPQANPAAAAPADLGKGGSFAHLTNDSGPPEINPPVVPTGPVRPPCDILPLTEWQGSGSFVDADAKRRATLAHAPEDLDALASLAEFYAAHAMPNEALMLLEGWTDDGTDSAARARLLRVRDIARLIHGQSIEAASPLLAPAGDCAPPEMGVWQALQAAALRDTPAVNAAARRARAALTSMPEPMRTVIALSIADHANDEPETLKAMVAALRNSKGGTPEDVGGRYLLQARVANVDHAGNDEMAFLEKAIQEGGGVPRLFASARLAGLQIRRAGEAGAHAEKLLQDLARTYRYESLGQEAALILGRQKLANGDFGAALELADQVSHADSSGGNGAAASFAAQALRMMLVDPKGLPLPAPADRVALFWHFEGYAPPGESGDDIRIAASKLLLDQGFADSALDVAHDLSNTTLATPDGLMTRARAEARADTGDAAAAIAMVQPQPDGADRSHVIADALARTGKPRDAAQAVAKLDDADDRTRHAALLYRAGAWGDAAGAYAQLLRTDGLDKDARADATRRYSLAVSLSQTLPGNAPSSDLLKPDPLSQKLLAVAVPPAPPPANAPPVASVRTALDRAKKIETLLNP